MSAFLMFTATLLHCCSVQKVCMWLFPGWKLFAELFSLVFNEIGVCGLTTYDSVLSACEQNAR